MPVKGETKAKVGRPTGYDPAYCERVVGLGKQGKSLTQIACALDVSKASLTRWADEHEEFRTAIMRAKEHEQDWWETAGQLGLAAERFNAAVWKKSMEARFRDDYTERKEVSGNLTISHEQALNDLDA